MMLDEAISYAHAGLPVFPVKRDKQPYTAHGFKDATTDIEKINSWFKEWPDAGIGMPTGTVSGRAVIDVDPRNGGDKSLAVLEEKYGPLPNTLESKTGGGGRHLFFSCDRVFPKCTFAPGLDFQSEGAYVILPPSAHASGNRYQWINGRPDPLELPQWFQQLLLTARTQARVETSGAASKIPQGRRNGHLTSLAGSMRHRGMSAEGILAALRCENDLRCDPPLQLAELQAIAKSVGRYEPTAPSSGWLRAVSVSELLQMDVKDREMILHPFLPAQGLAMLYSKRGVGKTFLSLGAAVASASGTPFLKWKAPAPRKVLYVDGEMPLTSIKQRISDILAGTDVSTEFYPNLKIITPDLQTKGIPDLATVSGQDEIEEHLDGVHLLVLDNLSSLARACKENEGEGWLPIQEWALDLRRRGISVLFVHHAGKGGAQRGTSRREDLLDSVVTLKNPADYDASQGLRCVVEYEKARGFYGEDAKSFEITMTAGKSGEAVWTVGDPEKSLEARIFALSALGMPVREIAEELGVSKSTVHRWLKGDCPTRAKPIPAECGTEASEEF